MHLSILSVQWDMRSLWAIMSHVAHLYLLALLGVTVFALVSSARILWAIRSREADSRHSHVFAKLPLRICFLRQLLVLTFLLFGVTLSNEVFGSLRAVWLSHSSLSAYPLQEALEAPTALAFVVCGTLVFLHVLQWYVSASVSNQFCLKQKSATQTGSS
jgi:hypothetical protein